MGDGGDAHVKVGSEGVEDLVGAHVGVGVDDTLTAALHDVGCEGDTGVVECALPAPSNAGSLSYTWGEILEARSTTADCKRHCSFALPRADSALRLLAGPRATPVKLSFGQLPID